MHGKDLTPKRFHKMAQDREMTVTLATQYLATQPMDWGVVLIWIANDQEERIQMLEGAYLVEHGVVLDGS